MHGFGAKFLESRSFRITAYFYCVSLSIMKTLINMRSSTGLLLGGLCACFMLAMGLPVSWGWENGPLENLQAVILLVGMLVAVMAAGQQRHMPAGKIWWVAALLWLGMLGRELAWGAVFLPAHGFDPETGPRFTSSILWWKPAVVWLCAALLAGCVYWVLRYRLIPRVLLRWLREGAMPWGCLAVFVLAMVLSAVTEGHGQLPALPLPEMTLLAMEEMAECWAYLSLWWGQWVLVHHMQEWRSSSYLQTMHFSLSAVGERFERRSI